MSYMAKDENTQKVQLAVQTLILPFTIGANATPASKVLTVDYPQVLHLKVEGIDYTTVANGGFGTSAEAAAVTFATATDATGVFNALIRVGEQINKVVSARFYRRGVAAGEIISATFPTGATSGITSLGDKIVLNFDSGLDFSSTALDAVLEVRYVVAE